MRMLWRALPRLRPQWSFWASAADFCLLPSPPSASSPIRGRCGYGTRERSSGTSNVIFPRFLKRPPRPGSSEDRGKVLRWPRSPADGSAAAGPNHRFQNFLRRVASGFAAGATDLDPSLVITATVAAAAYGYARAGLAFFAFIRLPRLGAAGGPAAQADLGAHVCAARGARPGLRHDDS